MLHRAPGVSRELRLGDEAVGASVGQKHAAPTTLDDPARSRTQISSAFATVDKRWAITRMVRPSYGVLSAFWIACSDSESSAEVRPVEQDDRRVLPAAAERDDAAGDDIAASRGFQRYPRPIYLVTKTKVAALRDRRNEQAKGLHAGGVPISRSGLKVQPRSALAERDMRVAEMLKLPQDHIALLFPIPLQLLGLGGAPLDSGESLMQFWLASGLGFAPIISSNRSTRFLISQAGRTNRPNSTTGRCCPRHKRTASMRSCAACKAVFSA
jgi:hypothetical protein